MLGVFLYTIGCVFAGRLFDVFDRAFDRLGKGFKFVLSFPRVGPLTVEVSTQA